jgi:putative redox protein
MEAKVIWKSNMSFEGTSDSGFSVSLGTVPEVGGNNDGFRPMELIAIGIAGCTAMDVISILQKKRQEVSGFDIKVYAERAQEHPKVFTSITVEYIISGKNIDPEAVNRAVELSSTKYCPAQAMLMHAVPITHTITIQ